LLKATCGAETTKLKEFVQIRDEEIAILRENNKPLRPYLWLTGGFVMGTATSIAIFKTVDND